MMKTGILHTQFITALLIPNPNSKEVSAPADYRKRTTCGTGAELSILQQSFSIS
jgi:hypothetical protein